MVKNDYHSHLFPSLRILLKKQKTVLYFVNNSYNKMFQIKGTVELYVTNANNSVQIAPKNRPKMLNMSKCSVRIHSLFALEGHYEGFNYRMLNC